MNIDVDRSAYLHILDLVIYLDFARRGGSVFPSQDI